VSVEELTGTRNRAYQVSVGSGGEGDCVGVGGGRKSDDLRRGGRLQDQRLAEIGVQQVFCRRQTRGVLRRIDKSGDVQQHGRCGLLGTKPIAPFNLALAQPARQTEDPGQRLNPGLLVLE
jgi:hypothetical protein